MRKYPIKALLPIFLAALFLLNTPNVLAAETDGMSPSEPPAVTESEPDEPEPMPEPMPEPPEGSVRWDVDTFEELYEALEACTPSETTRIRLVGDITIPKIEDKCTSKADNPIELDLGSYTLYVVGTLRLQEGVTLMGCAGEEAMIRVRPGGEANINNVTIQAGDRCAVWQEEGAIFTMSDFTGEVHYAERAVAIPYSFTSWQVAMPVAVVHDGQTLADVLPETDNVVLNHKGECVMDTYIAVDWDVDAHQAELDARTRTLITGSYPDAIALQQPVCLVVFQNGNPATFLDAHGMESFGQPKAKVKIELTEPERGCRFEWSQDGENWLSADAVETTSSDGRLAFTVSFPQETPPTYPYYLSAVVDYPDDSTGYSDVLIIESAETQCDSGGNRHGGGGITPPELPPLGGGADDTTPDEPDGTQPPTKPKPPAQSTPPVIETPIPALVTDPPAAAAVEPTSPHAGQTEDGTTTSTASFAQPEPSQSASSETADARAAMAPVASETEAPARKSAAPNAKAVAQVATGVAATGGIITLTMTWGRWSKRLISLLRKLLK